MCYTHYFAHFNIDSTYEIRDQTGKVKRRRDDSSKEHFNQHHERQHGKKAGSRTGPGKRKEVYLVWIRTLWTRVLEDQRETSESYPQHTYGFHG